LQEKVLDEIKLALAKSSSKTLDYTTVQTLPYLDMFLNECLRLYPLTPIERRCIKDYKIPGTNTVVPKDIIVQGLLLLWRS
jgi:cytochrome P450